MIRKYERFFEDETYFEKRDYEAERKEKKKKRLAKIKSVQDKIDVTIQEYMKKYGLDEKTVKSFLFRLKKDVIPNKIVAEHLFKDHKPKITFDMLDFIQNIKDFVVEYGVSEKEIKLYFKMTNSLYKIEELLHRLNRIK